MEENTKENAKWIEVVKKGKGAVGNKVEIMNATRKKRPKENHMR